MFCCGVGVGGGGRCVSACVFVQIYTPLLPPTGRQTDGRTYLHDDGGLVVALVVYDARAVDEVDALHQRDVLPHLGLACVGFGRGVG